MADLKSVTPADAVILGADTTVVVDGEILGKPRDDDDEHACCAGCRETFIRC